MLTIGVPKEIKIGEGRVGLTPDNINYLILEYKGKLKILVQKGAGLASGYSDGEYKNAGAEIVSKTELWKRSYIIVKVKEPQESEYKYLKDRAVFGYFHLNSPDMEELNRVLRTPRSKSLSIPYEDIIEGDTRPCLAPMSTIAGRLAAQKGAHYLESASGGMGKLMGGISSALPSRNANVLVVGGGVSGYNAAEVARGMGADVTIADINRDLLVDLHKKGFNAVYASPYSLYSKVSEADLVIGAVLSPGRAAPKVITSKMLSNMKKGSVVVDIAIDEGGCTAWSKPTSHENPTFVKNGVTFYCVTNIPGLVPMTATRMLTEATVPYLEIIIKEALKLRNNRYELSTALISKGVPAYYQGEIY